MADYIMNDDRDAKDILIELRESTGHEQASVL